MKYLLAHVARDLLEDNVENLQMIQLSLWITVKEIMNQPHMENTGHHWQRRFIHDALPPGSGALGEIDGAFGWTGKSGWGILLNGGDSVRARGEADGINPLIVSGKGPEATDGYITGSSSVDSTLSEWKFLYYKLKKQQSRSNQVYGLTILLRHWAWSINVAES